MALMTDGSFPFPAIGLVHLANRIAVHRPARADETFDLHVHATPIEPHPKGRTFAIVTEARVGEELVWEARSTMLRRGGGEERELRPVVGRRFTLLLLRAQRGSSRRTSGGATEP